MVFEFSSVIVNVILGMIIVFLGTIALTIFFRILGQNNLIGNLYSNVRGGIPRGIGLIPWIMISLFFPSDFNNLILVMGFFALLDDIFGRYKLLFLPMEIGQLFRGIGMIVVILLGYPIMGFSAILVALMIQPMNISDMQPGSTTSVVIIMSIISLAVMILIGSSTYNNSIPAIYPAIVLILFSIAYSPLDYMGKIMMGEVGNHSFAIALGIVFYLIGGFLSNLIFFILTAILISIIRRNTLNQFFKDHLGIKNPVFGDYLMDVLTGGGLGDLLRRVFLGKKQMNIKNPILLNLGFRRLFYNPRSVKKSKKHSSS
ncbi:MAG: cell wall biosynthesis protein [Methanobrevibacter sp.]|jgi:hypothetical protein|nr:cell wall biosynthesis protein [Methanobrevibacter sp.]